MSRGSETADYTKSGFKIRFMCPIDSHLHSWYNDNSTFLYNKDNKEIHVMKTAAKVFIILGMVLQCWMIFPLIIGIIALKKMKKATSKSELTVIAILTLLFCNTIGGILMLCLPESEFAAAPAPELPQEPQV